MNFIRTALVLVPALVGLVTARAQVPVWPLTTPADIAAVSTGVQLAGADYGNGTFVLSAYFDFGSKAVPAVETSADGTTWTRRTLPVTGALVGRPRFLNGKFFLGFGAATNDNNVPTGASGAVLTSADGITWTASTLGTSLYAPDDFVYGNNLYVALARPTGSPATQIITSADGVAWTPRTVAAGTNGINLTFFSGKFYCITSTTPFDSALDASADGIAWSRVAGAPAKASGLTAGSATLLVNSYNIGNSTQALSSDGATFTTVSPGLPLVDGDIRFLNGIFISPAQASATNFAGNQISGSYDGQTWTTLATRAVAGTESQDVREIAYGNGRYVFVGEFDVFAGTTTVTPGGTGTPSPTPTPTPTPTTTTTPTATNTASSGGGGAPSVWFFAALSLLGVGRRLQRSRG